ncbi:MAG: transcriptional repressor [bacterium]|nr:transcriptional repressor [bacterium]
MNRALRLASGMRQTPQRRQVWDAIGRLGGHCTADEITSEVQRHRPRMARSTVYRALEALTRSGALRAVRLGDGPICYEAADVEHPHAICQVCQGVLHIERGLLLSLEGHLEEEHHFTPVRTEVLVVGVCEACARARGRPAPRHRQLLDHVHHHEESAEPPE